MKIDDYVKFVELYHTECYPCHSKKYEPIRRWILDNGIALRKFKQNRIVLDRSWMMLARHYKETRGIEEPFVVIATEKGEEIVMSHNDFLAKANEIARNILVKQEEPKAEPKQTKKTAPKKKATRKTATIKKEKVIEK